MRFLILLCLALPAMGRQVSQFIVGGSNANIANYPHQLSLRSSGSHSCGASIISTTRAVCAAHCYTGSISAASILGGTSDRTVTTCSTCQTRNLSAFNRHGSFSNSGATGYPNDIAVLIFSAISYNGNTNAITLATGDGDNAVGATCTITGWGRTCGTCGLPATLQQASMTVLSNSACTSTWGAARINAGHICISASGRSACSGDSGGPMVCGGRLSGATSWGESSCNPSYPSVYTRVSYFRSWILAQ
jgi:secreted trypsin-like serine protease